jgi:hypothetical protein
MLYPAVKLLGKSFHGKTLSTQKLWTIQTMEAWQTLQRDRILYGNWSRVCVGFKEPYRWLMAQMCKRGIETKNPPIWAWERKPDLRCSAHLPKGKRGTRLLIEVPTNLVLLSEFTAWHSVLNETYLPKDQTELEAWYKNCESGAEVYSQKQMQESWERIFYGADIDLSVVTSSPMFQATFPHLELSWVLNHQEFTAR